MTEAVGSEKSVCDLLLSARWVVPVVPEGSCHEDYALAITGGKILAMGSAATLSAQFQARERVHLTEHVLMPGLVNAHTHAAMSLMRGIADDFALMPWLSEHIWPAEAKHVGADFVRDGVRLAIAEQIRGGVTCMQDMYFFPEQSAEVAIEMGMRAAVGGAIIEFASAYAKDSQEYLAKARAMLEHYRSHALITPILAPHAPYTVSDQSFAALVQLAHDFHARVHCHIHETAAEVEDSVKQHGMRPLARLDQLGVIDKNLTATHMTQLTPGEMERLAVAGVSIAHCPESNLKLASGFCQVNAALKLGINVALGTDGCASNNDLDMLGEMKTAALLAKAVANDATALNAAQALTMATLGGARSMGLDKSIGSLEIGKQADIIALRMDDLDALPIFNPISQLVYANHRRQVSDVWIAGRARLRNSLYVDIDAAAIAANARAWGKKIGEKN
jgi:5-methylthioadenosine/S-adenosylhomocysteine deaminase